MHSSSFARRKAFAIKHQEAEPLTRRDLQHDFLHHAFASQERVFTDPTLSSTKGNDPPTTVTFRDLYVHALMNSPRCSRALREKMVETPEFATDFAKISLLANVGRVNTTMTCSFPRSPLLMTLTVIVRSPSRNANGITYIPPRPFPPKGRCESSRCSPHKEYFEGLQP